MKRLRTAMMAAAGAAALISVTGCSEGREYALPDGICGVAVDSAFIAPLLPPGAKLEQSTYAARPHAPRCELTVDKNTVLTVKGDVTTADEDVMGGIGQRLASSGDPAQIDVGDAARVADSMAVAVARCTYEGKPSQFVVEIYPPIKSSDVPERREALTRLMTVYFPAAQKAVGCAS
ncbi:hypothetical protein [Streptomyces sp. NBC_01439]|uniref:hypothetical protein n=1 Tax=Streptomyces sp. NBC_01439 TaxID=2903867 RepID=UPI002E2811B3|nr:hypothetical protein [Streptomyces sp. NBC_01439]